MQKGIKTLKFVLVFLLSLITGCNSRNNFYASNAFYINDKAGALMSSTRYLVYAYSSALYDEDSQTKDFKDQKINGTQIVVATHLGNKEDLDTTAIFNDWKIGANDMGILLMLYFSAGAEEYDFNYSGITMEIGEQMAGFISMQQLNDTYDLAVQNAEAKVPGSYDYMLASFYIDVLNLVYSNVYNIDTFDASALKTSYEEHMYDSYIDLLPKETFNIRSVKWWGYLIIALIIIFLFTSRYWWMLLGYFLPTRGKGGGGRSGGYRYTK